MRLLNSLMPLIPQPYKNIIKFFLATLKNVDENNMDDVINNIANTLIPRNILFKHYDKIFRMVWIV